MQTFIDKITGYLIEKHENRLGGLCVVLPNRRAGLFLKRALAAKMDQPVWAPDVFSIGDFFCELSGLQTIDDLALQFEFYAIHCDLEGENRQPFEQFIRWAPVLLGDFDEIDAQLISADKLFGYLNEVKALEKWHLGRGPLTTTEQEYLHFYRSLANYHQRLRNHLLDRKLGYQGLINRYVAENIETVAGHHSWEKIYFAGFNALTAAENVLTDYLSVNGMAEMLWDTDAYYMDNPLQEAGLFLRKAAARSKAEFRWKDHHFKNIKKNISVYGVPKKVGQARLAADIVKQWINNPKNDDELPELRNCAVVLADESLLIPLLNALPEDLPAFNLTMGFPVKYTSLYQFLLLIFRLYENSERFAQLRHQSHGAFYYDDILRILQHPFLTAHASTTAMTSRIRQSNKVLYPADELLRFQPDESTELRNLLTLLFENSLPRPLEITHTTGRLIDLLKDILISEQKASGDTDALDLEYLYHFSRINNRLGALIEKYHSIENAKTLRQIFTSISATTRIPFSGEPLQGMQIMGMLETRNLDFDRIVLISANEGMLPAASPGNSFIPWDIQHEFGLHTFQEKNAVFAYHFYRLLQRAQEVHLIYDSEPGKLGGGEESRFIRQLMHELPAYHPETRLSQQIVQSPPRVNSVSREIRIDKDDEVFAALVNKAQSGLSPTTLNHYRNCPLQFYLQDIARLDEADEVEENLEARTMGDIVHYVLEKMYTPFVGEVLKPQDIQDRLDRCDSYLKDAYAKFYGEGDLSVGRNRLLSEVIRNFVVRYLQHEKTWVEEKLSTGENIRIKGLEKTLSTEFIVDDGESIPVKIKGKVDRLDECGGMTRIIDYKTGYAKATELHFASWDDFLEKPRTDKPFQVLTYAWLLQQEWQHPHPQFESGIISMRLLSQGLAKFGVKNESKQHNTIIDAERLNDYEMLLRDLLGEMFDRSLPFEQTQDLETCRNCNFKHLCLR